MIESIVYKKQGNGQDSWIVKYSDKPTGVVSFLTVDNWKLKSVLNTDGLLAQVEAALNSLEEPTKTNALLAWEYSSIINSNSGATELIRQVLVLDKNAMMNIFVRAINLEI
jgi:hypothetical protein